MGIASLLLSLNQIIRQDDKSAVAVIGRVSLLTHSIDQPDPPVQIIASYIEHLLEFGGVPI